MISKNFPRGEIGQKFKAGAEGRKSVEGRLRAAALGRFSKRLSLRIFDTKLRIFQKMTKLRMCKVSREPGILFRITLAVLAPYRI